MIRVLIALMLMLAACSDKPEVPENVLPPEKMEAITWDLIRADGLLTHALSTDTSKPTEKRLQMYQQVLRMHEVSKEQYKRSFVFYQGRPDLLRVVFNGMVEKASQLPRLTKDSLRSKPAKPAV